MARPYINKVTQTHARKENFVYLALWLVFALAPVVVMAVRDVFHEQPVFEWREILHVWLIYCFFLVPFLIHSSLIAPLLIYKHRTRCYFLCVAILVALFFGFQRFQRPPQPRHPHVEERMHKRPPRPHGDDRHEHPPFFFQQQDLVNTIVLVLIFGMNLGVKLYFKQETDRKKLEELERENLEQQLEYLKFQVNPHFFMNTLNNIHALVDIDPQKAKESIVVLSRMMRYLLYDGNAKMIPLEKELSFIRHYILLMRMRYTDHVRITVSVPERVPDAFLPPLALFTFVENAFKHGVTYRRDCFISLTIETTADRLSLECANSKADQPADDQGGVGLVNLSRRLDLIFGSQWSLTTDDQPEIYTAKLNIPLTTVFSTTNTETS